MGNLEEKVEAMMRLCVGDQKQDRQRLRQQIRERLIRADPGAMDPELEIRRILLELGAPDHLVGHPYVVRAVLLVMGEGLYIHNGLYPQLAVEFDTSPARVERAIRHLVEVTWRRGEVEVLRQYFGEGVRKNRDRPTNGEFIVRLAQAARTNICRAA